MRLRSAQGLGLIEISFAVVLMAMLSAIAIPRFQASRERAEAAQLTVELEMAHDRISGWGKQQGTFAGLTSNDPNRPGKRVYESLAGGNYSFTTTTNPPSGADVYLATADADAGGRAKSFTLVRCHQNYFESGAELCFSIASFPWGSASEPRASVERTVYCPNCSSNVFSAAGQTSGSLAHSGWRRLDGQWPQIPPPGAGGSSLGAINNIGGATTAAGGVAGAGFGGGGGGGSDSDGDGLLNSSDNCPSISNANQADADGDGSGDACDSDSDGDGVANASDNCPSLANPTQQDSDSDGIGNSCDPDRDGDTVANGSDNCPDAANAFQSDNDADGLGDACDPTPNGVDTSITAGPGQGSTTASTSASFSFSSNVGGATFECRLDGSGWSACTSPRSYVGLSNGNHTFDVRASSGGQSDTSPASRTWGVDSTAPNTSITGGPGDGSTITNSSMVAWSFSSTESGTFSCRIDGGSWATCTSGQSWSFGNGPHTFEVRAHDSVGNIDATPASRSFTMDYVNNPNCGVNDPACTS